MSIVWATSAAGQDRAPDSTRRGLDTASPYRLSYGLDAPLLAVGIGLTVGGVVWRHRLDPVSSAEIATLDSANVNAFDRVSTRLWNVPAQRLSDFGLILSFGAPAALYASPAVRRDGLRFTLMWLEVYLTTQGLTELTKAWAARGRPYMYNTDVSIADKTRGILASQGRTSFFSAHSSLSAALCFYAATFVQTHHPRSLWSRLTWASAVSLSALTASLRVIGGKHYPSDVIAGYSLGALVGVAIPLLHRIGTRKHAFALSPSIAAGRVTLQLSGTL